MTKTLVGIRPRTCAFKAIAVFFEPHDFQCQTKCHWYHVIKSIQIFLNKNLT